MESSLDNYTSNDSLLGDVEFPYWRPALATTLLSHLSFIGGCILVLYFPLLLALLTMKGSNFKPLDLIHASLLISVIVRDTLGMCLFVFYLPSIFRSCSCSSIIGTIFLYEGTCIQVYQPVAFACLSVLQFLVVFGKKKYVNVKTTCGTIAGCIGFSLAFVTPIVPVVHKSNERIICFDNSCPSSRPQSGVSILATVLAAVSVGSLIPSLVIVIVFSVWSCTIFRHYFTGGDDQLSRRMLSLPVLMPLAIITSSVVEVSALNLVGKLLEMLQLGDYSLYWILTIRSQLLVFFRIFSRLIYPLVLVYTHSHIRLAVKKMLRRLRCPVRNRVSPATD